MNSAVELFLYIHGNESMTKEAAFKFGFAGSFYWKHKFPSAMMMYELLQQYGCFTPEILSHAYNSSLNGDGIRFLLGEGFEWVRVDKDYANSFGPSDEDDGEIVPSEFSHWDTPFPLF